MTIKIILGEFDDIVIRFAVLWRLLLLLQFQQFLLHSAFASLLPFRGLLMLLLILLLMLLWLLVLGILRVLLARDVLLSRWLVIDVIVMDVVGVVKNGVYRFGF